MFAIDGCKLPSNASKEWSGTRAELTRKQQKIDRAVERMLATHRDQDQRLEPEVQQKQVNQIEKLQRVSAKIKKHLATEPERLGRRGTPIKGNITDPESAKMTGSPGAIWRVARRVSLKDETNNTAKGTTYVADLETFSSTADSTTASPPWTAGTRSSSTPRPTVPVRNSTR